MSCGWVSASATGWAMSSPNSDPSDHIHSESFLRALMRRQLMLSVAAASTFLLALFGMPLLNYFGNELK